MLVGLFASTASSRWSSTSASALYEAYRLAEGGGCFVPDAQQLLWAGVIVVMGSLALLTLSVLTATKR